MLVRLIIWCIVGFLIYTVVQMFKQALRKPPVVPPEPPRGEEMVQDPECGTYVPRNGAVKAQGKDGSLYFCSTACRDKFAARS